MKPSLKRTLGIILIVLSALSLVIGVYQIVPVGFADKPSFGDQTLREQITAKTRIAYSINAYSFRAFGGALYGEDISDQDEVTVQELHLRRDGLTLFVNDKPISTGKIYRKTIWALSVNPWLLFTYRFMIRNNGIMTDTAASAPEGVLYVSGAAYEGWVINPLGPIILGCGIWLLKRGKKEFEKQGT